MLVQIEAVPTFLELVVTFSATDHSCLPRGMALDFAALVREEEARLLASLAAGEPNGGPQEEGEREDVSLWHPPAVESHPTPPSLAHRAALDFPAHRAAAPVGEVFFFPDFLSEEEEMGLIGCAYHAEYGNLDSLAPGERWVALKHRRLQNWGGRVTPEGLVDQEPLPRWLQMLCERMVEAGVFPADKAPNHVLINEYRPGEGIMAHSDGPAYWPQVAILSMRCGALLHFQPRVRTEEIGTESHRAREAEESFTAMLPRRSLVVFRGFAYHDMLHSIEPETEEEITERCCNANEAGVEVGYRFLRETRLSFTIRHVPVVLSQGVDR